MAQINIEQDAVIAHFKATLLEKLTDEDRDKLISTAMEEILKVNLTTDKWGHSQTWGEDAMRAAISKVMREICLEILAEPETRKRLATSIRDAVMGGLDKIEEKLAELVTKKIIDAVNASI